MSNKTALVTGAAAGIGRACAIRLAKDGHNVGVLDLNLANAQKVVDEISAMGGNAIALEASIADRQQVEVACDKLRTAFSPITIVVNNAGISNFIPFEEITDDDWKQQFEINTFGTFVVTQTVIPDMKNEAWGRVINISSSSAISGSYQQVHYSASKGAVISMTRSLSQSLGKHGITVNNVPPGAVMQTIMSEENKERFSIPIETLERTIPVGRTGVPDDIASTVSWLASEETGYITGQTINVNGGRYAS